MAVTLLGFPDVKKFLEDYIRAHYTALYTHTRSRAKGVFEEIGVPFFSRGDFFRYFCGCVSLSLSLSAAEPSKLNK